MSSSPAFEELGPITEIVKLARGLSAPSIKYVRQQLLGLLRDLAIVADLDAPPAEPDEDVLHAQAKTREIFARKSGAVAE